MQQFFPTDVRVKIEGNAPVDAEALLGPTRRLLFLALALQERYGAARPVNLLQQVSPTAAIQVFLHGGQKIVTITAVATSSELQVAPPPDVVPIPPNVIEQISILNGWWKGPSNVVVSGKTKFHQYKPTLATADALHLPYGLQDNEKLKDETDALPSWASLWSGSIKRVVQAIWGLGEIDLPTISYIDGTTASPTKRTPPMTYPAGFTRTTGLYKATTRNHWLIEIGDRGVLAMPLILLAETTGGSYRSSANIDTRRILDEFGGLPSGEGFPASDDDLAAAIAAGKVLQLLTEEDIAPFYDGALQPYTDTHSGWAFSELGVAADNVGWRYDETSGGRWNDGDQFSWYTAPRSAWGEHWRINITLSPHNRANLPDNPIGSGSAYLSLVHRGRLDPRALFDIWYPDTSSGLLRRIIPTYWGADTTDGDIGEVSAGRGTNDCLLPYSRFTTPATSLPGAEGGIHAVNEGWGCNVHVFYEGESLRRVRWVCNKDAIYQWHFYVHDNEHHKAPGDSTTFSVYLDSVIAGSPKGFVLDGADDLRVPEGSRTPVPYRTQGIFGGPQTVGTTDPADAAAAQSAFFHDVDFGSGSDVGTGLIRDNVGCSMILVLPAGVREGAWIWREIEAFDFDANSEITNFMQKWDVTGRASPVGYLSIAAPKQMISSSSEPDIVFMRSYCNMTVRTDLAFWPEERDDPQPAAMFVANAGAHREYAATASIIRGVATGASPRYATSNMPGELTNLNPYTVGWIGSV